MISAQDIREKTFEKAVFGGYDMATVDTFLEAVASDLAALQKENATLRGKMKVLVSKVEEYRGNEDALRMAVVSAQRLGNMIEAEARDKATATINDAVAEAAKISSEAKLEVDVEKGRLAEAKSASADFIEKMNALCRQQLTFLEKISRMDFVRDYRESMAAAGQDVPSYDRSAEPAAEVHETISSIEETVTNKAEAISSAVDAAADSDMLNARAFSINTSPDDSLGKSGQFSFDNLGV